MDLTEKYFELIATALGDGLEMELCGREVSG